jgi:hypothetical protein
MIEILRQFDVKVAIPRAPARQALRFGSAFVSPESPISSRMNRPQARLRTAGKERKAPQSERGEGPKK